MRAKPFPLIIIATLLFLGVSGAVTFATSEDSNIIIVKTGEGGPVSNPGYRLSCSTRTETSITLTWNEYAPPAPKVPEPYSLLLTWGDSSAKAEAGTSLLASSPTLTKGTGSYTHNRDLAKGKPYFYTLKWGNGDNERATVQCRTLSGPTDAPSNLYAWALSPSSLLVNWKDNAARPHTFEVQRVKLTPEKPVFPRAGVQGAVTVSDSEIRLAWQNDTNSKTEKGPYYHAFERSTSTRPFADLDGDGIYEPQTHDYDPSFTKMNWAFADDVDVTKQTTAYAITDAGLSEGTDYYYRVRGCSFVTADFTREKPPTAQNDEHKEICGLYGDTASVGTSTLPASPAGAAPTNVTENSITLRWQDYSVREGGFAVQVSPAPTGGNCLNGTCAALANATPPGQGGYSQSAPFAITGLNPGTSYAIEVRSYRDGPWGRAHSAQSASLSAVTDVEISVGVPTGGTISGDCGSGQVCYFDYQTPVSFTATPSNGYEFTRWTEGPCTNATNPVCSFDATENTSMNALFTATGPLEVGDVNGDRVIDCTDVTWIQEAAAGTRVLTSEEQKRADVSGNGTVSAYDAALLTQNKGLTCNLETVRVKAFSDNVEVSLAAFTFTLYGPDGTLLASGQKSIPFEISGDYLTGADKKFLFAYGNGGPPGAQFYFIEWGNNVAGDRGSPGEDSIGAGYIPANGSSLEYRVYFTSAGGSLEPSSALVAQAGRIFRAAWGGITSLTDSFSEFAVSEWERVKEWFAVAFAAVEYQSVPGATVTEEKLQAYFRTLPAASTINQSVYEDTGLLANTVYLYRAKTVYTDSATPGDSDWSDMGAGKTLPASATLGGGGDGTQVNMCIRNSFCAPKPRWGVTGSGISSEEQCTKNDQCRDVGTSRQIFEETP